MTTTHPAKHLYSVTLPDGTVATRKTDRVYSHVVAVPRRDADGWAVSSWAGRLDLAQKAHAKAAAGSVVVPVDNPRPHDDLLAAALEAGRIARKVHHGIYNGRAYPQASREIPWVRDEDYSQHKARMARATELTLENETVIAARQAETDAWEALEAAEAMDEIVTEAKADAELLEGSDALEEAGITDAQIEEAVAAAPRMAQEAVRAELTDAQRNPTWAPRPTEEPDATPYATHRAELEADQAHAEWKLERDGIALRVHCSCGWVSGGYVTAAMGRLELEDHVADEAKAADEAQAADSQGFQPDEVAPAMEAAGRLQGLEPAETEALCTEAANALPTRVLCPLCIGATGRARTVPEQRYALRTRIRETPYSAAGFEATYRPCHPCRELHGAGLVSFTLTARRAEELRWDTEAEESYRLTHAEVAEAAELEAGLPDPEAETCPACGDPVDYCQGHGPMADPEGFAKLVEAGWAEPLTPEEAGRLRGDRVDATGYLTEEAGR